MADTNESTGNRLMTVAGNDGLTVGSDKKTSVGRNDQETVISNKSLTVGKDLKISAGQQLVISGKAIILESMDKVEIVCGQSRLVMKKDGSIEISGVKVTVKGSADVAIKGSKIAGN